MNRQEYLVTILNGLAYAPENQKILLLYAIAQFLADICDSMEIPFDKEVIIK